MATILKNVKCDISSTALPIIVKFSTAMHIRLPNLMIDQKILKSKADGSHHENQKSRYLENRFADYDEILNNDTY